jgi:Mg-chelatase subunit ChlI
LFPAFVQHIRQSLAGSTVLRQSLHQAAFVGNEQLVLLQELCHRLKVTSHDIQAVAAAMKKLSPGKCFRNREAGHFEVSPPVIIFPRDRSRCFSRENHSRASASQWKKRFSGGNRTRHEKSTTPRTRAPVAAAGQSKEANSPIAV